ncbi:hypothetical protein G7054_g9121 [Neopestalotiopsis clavispora]|nr:hypothetical protein E8E14_004428 [Neopestalotiopsis sp. 37M]KAF7531176.1 hypothetical protein G7054_g9121 [Neopestalotiopsis clavispora]
MIDVIWNSTILSSQLLISPLYLLFRSLANMVLFLSFLSLTAVAAALLAPRAAVDPDRYSVCGADRGYTEADSLAAADYLENTIVTSDDFFMAKGDCVYAHVNTTMVSLCNGHGRNRTVSRSEVKRGVNQLIKDCGLQGGFTGVHVVNNLTFAAYGVFGGINIAPPAGSPPPDTPGGTSRKRSSLVKRDCLLNFDGVSHTDCDWKNKMQDAEKCGDVDTGSDCQIFCEQRRTGLLGVETKAPGMGGEQQPVHTSITLEDGKEISISNGFSIGVDGVFKEAIGGGVSYSWSITETTTHSVSKTSTDTPPDDADWYGRWVYFPQLIESCGTISRKTLTVVGDSACGTSVCPPPTRDCTGDLENLHNVCSLVPKLDDNGQPVLYWAVRWEYQNGTALPLEKQSSSYKTLCQVPDPDGDGENECYTTITGRMLHVNYKEMEARELAMASER